MQRTACRGGIQCGSATARDACSMLIGVSKHISEVVDVSPLRQHINVGVGVFAAVRQYRVHVGRGSENLWRTRCADMPTSIATAGRIRPAGRSGLDRQSGAVTDSAGYPVPVSGAFLEELELPAALLKRLRRHSALGLLRLFTSIGRGTGVLRNAVGGGTVVAQSARRSASRCGRASPGIQNGLVAAKSRGRHRGWVPRRNRGGREGAAFTVGPARCFRLGCRPLGQEFDRVRAVVGADDSTLGRIWRLGQESDDALDD